MKRLREWAKTILIYLLIAAAVFQTILLWDAFLSGGGQNFFERFFGEETPVYEGQMVYEQLSYAQDVLQPLGAAVRTQAASDTATLYTAPSREAASAVFDRASLMLTQALESAAEPSLITSDHWQAVLDAPMVMLDFGGAVGLDTLAYLMGAGLPEGLEGRLRWLVMASVEDTLWLCYRSEERGIYAMQTQLDGQSLENLCGQYEPDGSFFAYERGLGEARNVLLVKQERMYPVVTTALLEDELTQTEYDRMLAAVLEGLGFNSYTVRSYTESDGTKVYMEDERVLRLDADGRISFTDGLAMITAGEPDVEARAARIGEASRLAESVLSVWLGDAGFYLMDAAFDEETGEYNVTLGLEIGGEVLIPEQGFGLRVAFRGSRMVAADFVLRSYRMGSTSRTLMPAAQALAAAGGKAGFGVYYVEVKESTIAPGWYVKE